MQLLLARFSIIVLLIIISVLGVTSKGANEGTSEQHHHIQQTADKLKRGSDHDSREGRTTFVKAILSNPESPTQVLAKKFAEESLKSPRMQATFKRLSEIQSPQDVENGMAKVLKTRGIETRSVKNVRSPNQSKHHHKHKKHDQKRKHKKTNKNHQLRNEKRSQHNKRHKHHPHSRKHHRHHHHHHRMTGYNDRDD